MLPSNICTLCTALELTLFLFLLLSAHKIEVLVIIGLTKVKCEFIMMSIGQLASFTKLNQRARGLAQRT